MIKKFLKNKKGFTLLEMLVVLFIISILLLLFIPNLSRHRQEIEKKEQEGIVRVVETQQELYQLEYGKTAKINELVEEGYLTQAQKVAYEKYEQLKDKPK